MAASRWGDEATTEAGCRRVLLTVRDAVGKGAEGQHFWSPKFCRGFVEVKSGKSKTCKVATGAKDVEDFELIFNEELVMMLPEDRPKLIVNLRSGDVKDPGSVVGRCGIDLEDIDCFGPIEKYFNLYKMSRNGNCERGGYIHVSMKWQTTEDREQGPSAMPMVEADMELDSADSDRFSTVALDDGESRTILTEEEMLAAAPWVTIPIPPPDAWSVFHMEDETPPAWLPSTSSDLIAVPRGMFPPRDRSPLAPSPPATLTCVDRPVEYQTAQCLSSGDDGAAAFLSADEQQPRSNVAGVDALTGQRMPLRWQDAVTHGSAASTSPPGRIPHEFLLESVSPTSASTFEMPRLDLTFVPHGMKGQETNRTDPSDSNVEEGGEPEARGQVSLELETSRTSLSSQMFSHQCHMGQTPRMSTGIIHHGPGGAGIDISPSESATDITFIAQQRSVPSWLLLTLTAVGGAAAVALKVLGAKEGAPERPADQHREERGKEDGC